MISGERIQELCDVYCGLQEDFSYNPRIQLQTQQHIHLPTVTSSWNNPRKIFCYTHRLDDFVTILPWLENEFILVSHNSDGTVTEKYLPLLQHPKLLFWHAQNVLLSHPKLGCLPIGLANSMWPHGNQEIISTVIAKRHIKIHSVFFNFSVHTNPSARIPCYEALKEKLLWQPTVGFQEYLDTMATYKYAICPPGNGVDCHRIWECIYLGVIPILLRSPFTERIPFPCYIVDKWEDVDVERLLQIYLPPEHSLEEFELCINEAKDFFICTPPIQKSTAILFTGLICGQTFQRLIEQTKTMRNKFASVWENENPDYINTLIQNNFTIITNNTSLQKVFTPQFCPIVSGIQKVKELGFDFVLKTRFDVIGENYELYIKTLQNKYPTKITVLCGIKTDTTYFMDIMVFGTINDMCNYFTLQAIHDGRYPEKFLMETYSNKRNLSKEDIKDLFNFSLTDCIEHNIEFIWYRPSWGLKCFDLRVINEYCKSTIIWI